MKILETIFSCDRSSLAWPYTYGINFLLCTIKSFHDTIENCQIIIRLCCSDILCYPIFTIYYSFSTLFFFFSHSNCLASVQQVLEIPPRFPSFWPEEKSLELCCWWPLPGHWHRKQTVDLRLRKRFKRCRKRWVDKRDQQVNKFMK